MNIYIIEYLKSTSLISKVISFISGMKYSHSAMFIEFDNNRGYFAELDATDAYPNEPDYHIVEHPYSIRDWLLSNDENERTEAYKIPFNFSIEEISLAIKWWSDRQMKKVKYGYTKLPMFLWLIRMRPFMQWYYRAHKHPYKLELDTKNDVCSIAVDECLMYIGYDAFPEFTERCTYPGLFAEKFKNEKVEIGG